MSNIPKKCLIHGEGVAVWEAQLPQEPTVGFVESDAEAAKADAATYETVTLYRPVRVDVNDDGEAYAYYYRSEAARRLESRKVYVDPRYVYRTPLPDAKPARQFGCDGPADGIARDDVPDEYAP